MGKHGLRWLRVAMACALVLDSCLALEAATDRVPVWGGRYQAGASSGLQRKAQTLCASTSPPGAACGPQILQNEGRRARRSLNDFEIDRFEVSQERYRECVAVGACMPADWPACRYGDGTVPSEADREILEQHDRPAVCVTFEQARSYCLWRLGDLPDEAQWEKAAGGQRLFPWGDKWNPALLNWGDDGKADGFQLSAPVASFPGGASPFGVQNMVGNVWEWAIRLPELDDAAAYGKQVIRGGGFAAPPYAQRIHKRAPYDPARGYPNVGFRCVYP